MAFNPFLSINEPVAPVTADVLNPFMMSDPEPDAFTGDNPFATSNPFSDFGGGFEPAAGDTVPVDIFGGPDPPGGGARHFDGFVVDAPPVIDIFASPPPGTERLVKPTELELVSTTADVVFGVSPPEERPALPSRPLPPETQNLILTVTGQMEFTSSDLLDRIPPTRTPSPVSVRDIHSPSPTPEPEFELDPEPASAPVPAPVPAPTDSFDINRNKPARPPPARPPAPPRPAPPPPPQRPAAAAVDDINLFDAPAPTVFKPTKEAILSLYSAPKKEEEKQIDFLSDDISEDVSVPAGVERKQSMVPEVTTLGAEASGPAAAEGSPSPAAAPVAPVFAASPPAPVPSEPAAPMDCSEPAAIVTAPPAGNSPFADVAEDDFQVEQNPFGSVGVTNSSASVFPTTTEDAFMASYGDTFGSGSTGMFGAEKKSSDVFGAPAPPPRGEPATDVFGGPADAFGGQEDAFGGQQDAFGGQPDAFGGPVDVFPDAAQEAAAAWGAGEAMVQDSAAFPESQDAFDAFSAKFDSTAAQHMNTGECPFRFHPKACYLVPVHANHLRVVVQPHGATTAPRMAARASSPRRSTRSSAWAPRPRPPPRRASNTRAPGSPSTTRSACSSGRFTISI